MDVVSSGRSEVWRSHASRNEPQLQTEPDLDVLCEHRAEWGGLAL